MAALSFPLSLYVRVGTDFHTYALPLIGTWDAVFALVAAIVFASTGLYRGLWRYASLSDLAALLRAVSLVILLFFVLLFLINRSHELPRSLFFINWMVLTVLLGG